MISKTFFIYKILNCYFTSLECKVFKIYDFLKWSKITRVVNTMIAGGRKEGTMKNLKVLHVDFG